MGQSCNTESTGQQERILDLLKSKGYWNWVQLWEILDLQPRIVDINTRLWELRHKRDLNIQNKKWRVNGVTRSAYRLLPGSYAELGGKPESEKRDRSFLPSQPGKSWEEICRERDEKLRKAAPEFELTP